MKCIPLWSRWGRSQIIIYADFIDPFCYMGVHNLRRVAEPEGIPLLWRGFELNPETPIEGAPLQTAANSDLRPGMWASVSEFGKKSGLSLAEPSYVPNTRLAHLWIQSIPESDVKNYLIERLYQAYLSDKRDIGNPQILTELAVELGLPAKEIQKLRTESRSSRLEGFRQEALGYRFPGMPGFHYRGKTFFGALSKEAWRVIFKIQK